MKCGNKTEKMMKGGMAKKGMDDKKEFARGGRAKSTRPGSGAGTKAFAKGGSVRGTGCATKGTSFKGTF